MSRAMSMPGGTIGIEIRLRISSTKVEAQLGRALVEAVGVADRDRDAADAGVGEPLGRVRIRQVGVFELGSKLVGHADGADLALNGHADFVGDLDHLGGLGDVLVERERRAVKHHAGEAAADDPLAPHSARPERTA